MSLNPNTKTNLSAYMNLFLLLFAGMVPHKTPRGKEALKRLKVFEGIPPPYDKRKRLVIPSALKVLRLNPCRKVTLNSTTLEKVFYRTCVSMGDLGMQVSIS